MTSPVLAGNVPDIRNLIARVLANSALALSEELVAVASDAFPAADDNRLGKSVDDLSPLVASDLAVSGFSIEAPSRGRQRTHLLLHDFPIGSADLRDGHARILNLLRVPAYIGRDFRIERVIGGASQTGTEAGTPTSPGNAQLAADRAAVVTSWLVFELGQRPQDVQAVSFGSEKPLIDRTGHPGGLEEPLNRYAIVTYSIEVREAQDVEPVPVPPVPLVPDDSCPLDSSVNWKLDQKGEISLDITVPVAGIVGVGGGIALRVFELHMLDGAGNTIEKRRFAAIGGGGVADVDPLAFSKEAQQVAEVASKLRKILKGASLSGAMTAISWSTDLAKILPVPGLRDCLSFENFDVQLMTTQTLGAGVAGQTGSLDFTRFPVLNRATTGISVDVGFDFVPGAALKRQSWLFFEWPE